MRLLSKVLSPFSVQTSFDLPAPISYRFGLQDRITRFSPHDYYSLEDCFQGFLITGQPGSGKTTGSGAHLAHAFLEAGFGGLVCTHKADEVPRWVGSARATGRAHDLLIVSPDMPWRFNFLEYQYARAGEGAGYTQNAVAAFMQVMESRYKGGHRQTQDDFWINMGERLLWYSMELIRAADEDMNVANLMRIVRSAPYGNENTGQLYWPPDSYCSALLAYSGRDDLREFFEREWGYGGAGRQNAGVLATLTSMMHPFTQDR